MMGRLASLLARIWADRRGAVAIETAIVAPVLVLLALGSFDVSGMISAEHDLQNGATDLEGIVLAVSSGTATSTAIIQSALVSSLGLSPSQVTVDKLYRCGTATAFITSASLCTDTSLLSTYVQVTLTNTYTPTWTKFGVGGPISFNVVRTVEVS